MRVAVLLATRNGRRWIEPQLASLWEQTDQSFTVFASDDGSTDGTTQILQTWAQRHPDRFRLTVQARCLGYQENFRWLIRSVDADAYFFCDQDDVWLPNKVTASLQALSTVSPERPAMAFTDLEVVDDNLKSIHPSLWTFQRTPPVVASHLRQLIVINVVTGCASVMNRSARDLIVDQSFEPCHDHAIALNVLRGGGALIPVSRSLVRYRQHDGNGIGARPFLGDLGAKATSLFLGSARVLARRAVSWGVFRTQTGYYTFKLTLWLRRFFGWGR